MKKFFLYYFIMSGFMSFAQTRDLPSIAYKGANSNYPLIFYISGDGGWNSFSTSLVNSLNKDGYPVIGLNARSYFWTRKSPQQAAEDVTWLMNQYVKTWNIKSIVIIGYSFGADVAPFILNRLPFPLSSMVKHLVLMSPSKKTDFEIHLLGMMGLGNSSGQSVPDEINKLNRPVLLMQGNDEKDFPLKSLTVKNLDRIKMAGGHHYDGNVDEVIKQIINKIK